MSPYPILVTSLFISITCLTCRLLNALIGHYSSGDTRHALLEAVASFFICALSLEKAHVRWQYGTFTYCVISIVGDVYFSHAFPRMSGTICDAFHRWFKRELRTKRAFTLVVLQIIGGVSSLYFARLLWFWSLTDFHFDRFTNFFADSCKGDLNVSLLAGFLLEFSATAFNIFVSKMPMRRIGTLADYVKSFLNILIVIYGINLTGVYCNPINASNNNFGCAKVNFRALILVYWLGPISASIVTASLFAPRRSRDDVSHQSKQATHQNGSAPKDETVNRNSGVSNGKPSAKRKGKKRINTDTERITTLRRR